MTRLLRRILIGKPLHNLEIPREKLPKWKALAIFSSDAISSVAYGPEQIMVILAIPSLLVYGYLGVVALAILGLLAIVTLSYVQVARANPGGGGSYAVAIRNLGEIPALTAAAALFADYTLTVAVSVAAGTAAIVSAFPILMPHEVTIDLVVLFGLLTLINLRGIRESANVFVLPTYTFIGGMVILILAGCYQIINQSTPVIPPQSLTHQENWLVLSLVLRAFANGCSSLTGVEAISNGVPMFRPHEVRNATITTYAMSGILGTIFAGIILLIMHFHLQPVDGVTALSQLAELTFGRNWLYYYVQVTTMLILYLAANTSYNGLPPLLSILAQDGYMPHYLGTRGERLSFSNGIILLSIVASLLIIGYHGDINSLVSLFAMGVFLSFTIAQTAMVSYWYKNNGPGWQLRAVINGIGAIVTGVVVLIIGISKFLYGAWIVIVFIPCMVFVLKKIKQHYNNMAEQLHFFPTETLARGPEPENFGKNIVLLPIATLTSVVANTLCYAKTISQDIIVLHIATDEISGEHVRQKWQQWNPGIPLVIIYSPYRMVIQPLLDYINEIYLQKQPQDYITVLIPEFETKRWWHRLLHNQTGWILRTLLILKENVIVTTVPFHLQK